MADFLAFSHDPSSAIDNTDPNRDHPGYQKKKNITKICINDKDESLPPIYLNNMTVAYHLFLGKHILQYEKKR